MHVLPLLKRAAVVSHLMDCAVAVHGRGGRAVEQWRDAIAAMSFEQGEAVGLDKGLKATRGALRRILARRGIELRPEDSARIDACADLPTLERWLEEAAVAGSAEEALR
jgi:hypothetical protein